MKLSTKLLHALAMLASFFVTKEAYASLETLHVIDVSSNENGIVEITIERPQVLPSNLLRMIVYRADGEAATVAEFQRLARRVGNATYPHIFYDTAYSPEIYSTATSIKIRISGLKTGIQSFYVTQVTTYAGNVTEESSPSNMMATSILGDQANDGQIAGSIYAVTSSSGVQEYTTQTTLRSWPNPATTQFRIECPILNEKIQVHIVDALGTTAQVYQTTSTDGICIFDVASLPNGSYTAILTSNRQKFISRFSVLR